MYEYYAEKYNQLCGARDVLEKQRVEAQERHARDQGLLATIDKVSTVVSQVAKETQEKIKVQLDGLVTKALHTIYPEELYRFELVFVTERGQSSVYPFLYLDDNEIDPLSSSGGMAEIIAFALRVALMIVGRKPCIVMMDEPFTGVSLSRIPLVQQFLQELSRDLGIQFILTSHISGFTDDCTLFRVDKIEGVSRVTR